MYPPSFYLDYVVTFENRCFPTLKLTQRKVFLDQERKGKDTLENKICSIVERQFYVEE